MSKEKKRPKNLQRLDDYNTLRRETKGFQPKKFPPPEFSVKDNLTYAAKQGVKKAKEVGKKVVDKATKGKAYGGKVKKMADGGKISVKTKKEMRETTSKAAKAAEAKKKEQQMKKFVARKAQELKEKKRKSELADKVYRDAYKKYQKEENNPNSRFPKADRALARFGDKVGDVARKIGKKFGSNRVTSQDDEAQMEARKDVKGFKEGGKIRNSKPVPMPNPKRSEFKSNMPQLDGEAREKAMREKLKKSTPGRPRYDSKKILDKITGRSASRRIASGGKVKKMAHGGSVGRGDGCAVRGKTKGRMV